jgi:hypothetical protein
MNSPYNMIVTTNKNNLWRFIMSNTNSNKTSVPEAKSAMNKFKMEVANEIGVPLSDGYNGNLTSAQNGSVGGYMVKKMIEAQEKQMAGK